MTAPSTATEDGTMFGRRATEIDTTDPSRPLRLGVTLAVLLALLSPVVLQRDDHPLSTYPMYARTRSNVVTFATAQLVDDAGRRSSLSLTTIGASDDPLIVAGELRVAISNGSADRRCQEIAARLGPSGVDGSVEVVTEQHDTIAAANGRPSLLERRQHARCEVTR